MSDFTGPWGMTAQQVDDFYSRWKEVMLVAAKHDAIVVASSDRNVVAFFKDMTERLNEDPWWKLSAFGLRPPIMMFRKQVPPDELLFHVTDPITKATRLVTIQEVVNSAKGFGRFSRIAGPTRDGVRPWSTMTPDDLRQLHVPQPDVGNVVKPAPESE